MASIKAGIGTPLDAVPGIDELGRRRLAAVSITTAEELLGVIAADPNGVRLLLAREDLTHLASDAGSVASLSGTPSLDEAPDEIFHTGANAPDFADEHEVTLDEIDQRAQAAPSTPDRPDPGADLRSCFGPIRYQGDRQSCVAFTVAALTECLLRRAGLEVDLSEQYVYWNAKDNDGRPDQGGTFIKVAIGLQVQDGAYLEATWPYVLHEIAGNEGQGPPPSAPAGPLAANRLSSSNPLTSRSLADLRAALDADQPVAISVPVFPSWKGNSMLKLSGFIPMPLPGNVPGGGHAMCAAGYGYDDEFAGGGYFILRNSWGTQFAPQSPIEPGYALLPFAYWEDYGWEVFVGTR